MHRFSIRRVFFVLFSYLFHKTAVAAGRYNEDCSANERLRCRVIEDVCSANPQSDDFPSAPYDLRMSPFLLANPQRKPDLYELLVNISWLPTHERNINQTVGFEMSILDKDTSRLWCFTFQLDQPGWMEKDRFESTRFHFSTSDMFDYGHNYHIELQSLPKPLNYTAAGLRNRKYLISQEIIMPDHPESSPDKDDVMDYCKGSGAHPHASGWLAAFNTVHVIQKIHMIYIEFTAAPVQYCFEQYELRLIDDNQLIVQNAKIQNQDLIHQQFGEISVSVGNYTFYNVNVGLYEIGVLPVAHSIMDSRCLCPMAHRMCSCSMSIWPDVRVTEPELISTPTNPCDYLPPVKLPFDCPSNANRSAVIQSGSDQHAESSGSIIATLVSLIIGTMIVLLCGTLALIVCYRRYKKRGIPRMYLLPISSTNTEMEMSSMKTVSTEMSTVIRPIKLTIIYAHDCPEFDRVVRDLVDYLNNQCLCHVRADFVCPAEIAANKFDWAYKSIFDADRVLLLNSYGAYMRYQAKLMNWETSNSNTFETSTSTRTATTTIIERSDPIEFDDLFLLQLEFLAQECRRNSSAVKKFISIRFPFTPDIFILPHANPCIRYELPKHFRSLIIDLHRLPVPEWENEKEFENILPHSLNRVNSDQYNTCREGERLKESIEVMKKLIRDQPDWFEKFHVRRTRSQSINGRGSISMINDQSIMGNSACGNTDRSILGKLGSPLITDKSIIGHVTSPMTNDQSIMGKFDESILENPTLPFLGVQSIADRSTSPLISIPSTSENHAAHSSPKLPNGESRRDQGNHGSSEDSGIAGSNGKQNNNNTKPKLTLLSRMEMPKMNGVAGGGDGNEIRAPLIT